MKKDYFVKGYSSAEVILVMLLLVIFSALIFSFVYNGGKLYSRLDESRNEEAELRTAISFINTKLRQHDAAGGVSIRPAPGKTESGSELDSGMDTKSEEAIVFTMETDGVEYETWVMLHEGKMIEIMTQKGKTPDPDMGFEIARLDALEFAWGSPAKNEIVVKAAVKTNEKLKTIETGIALMSGVGF